MTKMGWLAVFVALVLIAPVAMAHGAPKPREFQTRLLADCEDDVGGQDGHSGPGYDLHSLDVFEVWDNQDLVRFRVVLNGGGASTVTLDITAGGAKSYSWSTSDGNSWTGSGFLSARRVNDVYVDNNPDNGQDGNRFALEGTVKASDLGGLGAKITDYALSSTQGYADQVPGRDGVSIECKEPFKRADYQLKGPTRYAKLSLETDQALLSDTANFLDVKVESLLTKELQTASLSILKHDGTATVRFHDPKGSGDGYSSDVSLSLGKRGGAGSVKLVHLAIEGPGGASGTVDVQLTTSLGGRVVQSISYSIPESGSSTMPASSSSSSGESNGAPGVAIPLVVAFLAAVALRRRS